MALSSDPRSYLLSQEESRRIFTTQILPRELPPDLLPAPPTSSGSRRPPLAVLVVGQTGAGKTHVAPAILAALGRLRSPPSSSSASLPADLARAPAAANSGTISAASPHTPATNALASSPSTTSATPYRPAHLVADVYKAYHPAYSAILSAPSPQIRRLASPATAPDARRWLAMACLAVVARRLDVVVESAARHPEDFQELVMIFRKGIEEQYSSLPSSPTVEGNGIVDHYGAEGDEHGREHKTGVNESITATQTDRVPYRVEIVVLAVPAPLSRLGILTRFYDKASEKSAGPNKTATTAVSGSGSSSGGSLLPNRLTPTQVHDESYRGLEEAARWLDEGLRISPPSNRDGEQDDLSMGVRVDEGTGGSRDARPVADRVVLVRRGNLVAWSFRASADTPTPSTGLLAALRRERIRPLPVAESASADEQRTRLRLRTNSAVAAGSSAAGNAATTDLGRLAAQLDEIDALLKEAERPVPRDSVGEFPPLKRLWFPCKDSRGFTAYGHPGLVGEGDADALLELGEIEVDGQG